MSINDRSHKMLCGLRKYAPGLIALALLVPVGARADLWTNAAGHAIEATLVSLSRNVAVFSRPDGTRFDMPLASLAPASQKIVLESFGSFEVPERQRSAYGLCVRTMKRLENLHTAGQLSEEKYLEQREAAIAQLEQACVNMDVPKPDIARLLLLVCKP